MLLLLVWWAVLLAVALPIGAALVAIAGGADSLTSAEDRFFACAWIGLFGLSSLLLSVSFLSPLTPVAAGLAGFVAAGSAAASRPARTLLAASLPPRSVRPMFAWIVVAAGFGASGPLMAYDSGLYHYPLLRWLADYGTVPGMALAYFRYGFSSSWLATAAAFDFGPWQGRTSGVTGGIVLALLVCQFALALRRISTKSAAAADIYIAFALPVFFTRSLMQGYVTSPSPNFPVTAAMLLAGWLLVQARNDAPSSRNLALLMAAGAVGVKLSAAAALGVAGLACLWTWRRLLVRPLVPAALLVLPMLAANYISTGCPLFPASVACSEGPHGIGVQVARGVTFETLMWARYQGTYPPDAKYFASDWFDPWFHRYAGYGNWIFPLALILGIWLLARRRDLFWPAALGTLGTVYVFLSAPDQRFAIGYAATVFGLSGLLVPVGWLAWLTRFNPRFWTAAAVLVLVLNAAMHEWIYARMAGLQLARPSWTRLIAPVPVPVPPFEERHVNTLDYFGPTTSDQCWAIPQPCSPYLAAKTVRLCDTSKGIEGGLCRTVR